MTTRQMRFRSAPPLAEKASPLGARRCREPGAPRGTDDRQCSFPSARDRARQDGGLLPLVRLTCSLAAQRSIAAVSNRTAEAGLRSELTSCRGCWRCAGPAASVISLDSLSVKAQPKTSKHQGNAICLQFRGSQCQRLKKAIRKIRSRRRTQASLRPPPPTRSRKPKASRLVARSRKRPNAAFVASENSDPGISMV
jgi:hypothetical protein